MTGNTVGANSIPFRQWTGPARLTRRRYFHPARREVSFRPRSLDGVGRLPSGRLRHRWTLHIALGALNRRCGLCVHFQGANFQTSGLTFRCQKGNERQLCSKHLWLKKKKILVQIEMFWRNLKQKGFPQFRKVR